MECKFISIDASMRNIGVAVGTIDDDHGIKVTEIFLYMTEKTKNKQVRASSDVIVRCREIHQFLTSLIEKYQPGIIFAETPQGSMSSSAMKSYGIVCMLLASLNPPPLEVSPLEVKMGSIGVKTASKEEIIDWAYKKYPDLDWRFNRENKLQDKNEHMADAIAVTYAGVQTSEFKRIFNLIKK